MLEAENIFFSYQKGEPPVLKGVSLSVGPGERVGVLAPSGYGKTTLMKILAGYLQPDAGRVLVDGKPLPAKGYCPVQMVWQHPERAVNPRLTLRKTLAEGDGIDRRLEEGLGIEEDWKGRFPQELSGGEAATFLHCQGAGKAYQVSDCGRNQHHAGSDYPGADMEFPHGGDRRGGDWHAGGQPQPGASGLRMHQAGGAERAAGNGVVENRQTGEDEWIHRKF